MLIESRSYLLHVSSLDWMSMDTKPLNNIRVNVDVKFVFDLQILEEYHASDVGTQELQKLAHLWGLVCRNLLYLPWHAHVRHMLGMKSKIKRTSSVTVGYSIRPWQLSSQTCLQHIIQKSVAIHWLIFAIQCL